MKIFFISVGVYGLSLVTHLYHRNIVDLLQNDIRNTLLYAAFLPLLPSLINKKETVEMILKQLLHAGAMMSVFGIITRAGNISVYSWNGRVTSTMGDPNNFAVFLIICILILISRYEEFQKVQVGLYLLVYSLAFVVANSTTAFIMLFMALFIFSYFRFCCNFLKKIAILMLYFYVLILISLGFKVTENPSMNFQQIVVNEVSVDAYMVDKLNKVVKNVVTDEKFRTVDYRVEESRVLKNELKESPMIPLLFGQYSNSSYKKFDNQYFNLLYNTGLMGIISINIIFVLTCFTGMSNWLKYRCTISLALSIFIISMLLVGFNGSAFLNRFPINLLMYVFVGIVYWLKDFYQVSQLERSSEDERV